MYVLYSLGVFMNVLLGKPPLPCIIYWVSIPVVETALNTFGITQDRFKSWFNLKECNCTKERNGSTTYLVGRKVT